MQRKPLWDGYLRYMNGTRIASARESLTGRSFARHERNSASDCAGNPYAARLCGARSFRVVVGAARPDFGRVYGLEAVAYNPLRGGSGIEERGQNGAPCARRQAVCREVRVSRKRLSCKAFRSIANHVSRKRPPCKAFPLTHAPRVAHIAQTPVP